MKLIKVLLFCCVISFDMSLVIAQESPTDSLLIKKLDEINQNVSKVHKTIEKERKKPAVGQSIFEDREGESAIFIPYGGIARINTGDASFKLSYICSVTNVSFFYGFDFSGKATNGIRSVIEKGDISPGGSVNLILGFKEFFKRCDNLDGWLTFRMGYEADRYKLFNPNVAFINQITNETFTSTTFSLSFNLKIDGNKLAAISIGHKKTNNFSELKEMTIRTATTLIDSTTNTVRDYGYEETARMGLLKEKRALPINLDFFWFFPNRQRIGFHHFWRKKVADDKTIHGLGTGVYLLKEKNPLNAVAGLVLEIKDLSKLNKDRCFIDCLSVSFIVGYNFSFN